MRLGTFQSTKARTQAVARAAFSDAATPQASARRAEATRARVGAHPEPQAGLREGIPCDLAPAHTVDVDVPISSREARERTGRLFDIVGPFLPGTPARSLGAVHAEIARKLFGAEATEPVSYLKFRRRIDLAAREGAAGDTLASLDVKTRARVLEGSLSPLEILGRVAQERSGWRHSAAPISRSEVLGLLRSESRADELRLAHGVMNDAARARFLAGQMTGAAFDAFARKGRRREVDVVVVGAGMAGLAAADALMQRGHEVVVLEAASHMGGRARTDPASFHLPFDMGCAWLHSAPENPLLPLVRKRGFTAEPDSDVTIVTDAGDDWAGAARALSGQIDRLWEICATVGREGRDVSCGPLLQGEDPRIWAAAAVTGPLELGVDIDEVSTKELATVMPEVDDYVVREGLGTFVESFSHGVPIEYDAPVSAVRWTPGEGVHVDAAGATYAGRAVLVTTSTGVLARGDLRFDPPLPAWKEEAIRGLPMGNYDKIALAFSEDVFPGVEPSTRLRRFGHPESPLDFVLRPFGAQMAVGFVGGSFARSLGPRPEHEKIELALSVLEETFGPRVRTALTATKTTAWGEDPLAYGSYSAARPGLQHLRRKLAEPVEDTIFFAGEACHERWGQHLTGAYLSGLEGAERIAAALHAPAAARG